MPARNRDFNRPANLELPLDVGKIGHERIAAAARKRRIFKPNRGDVDFAVQKIRDLPKRVGGDNLDSLDKRRLVGGVARQNHPAHFCFSRQERERNPSANIAYRARECELARNHILPKLFGGYSARRGEQPQSDWQVVHRAFLADIAGSQVYRGARLRHRKAAVCQSRHDPVLRLFNRGVRKPHHEYARLAPFARIYLDFHSEGVDARQRARMYLRKHLLKFDGNGVFPERFELVKAALLLLENVRHKIERVDDNPAAARRVVAPDSLNFELF